MAKIAREQAVREKRARKQEKRDDKKQAAVDALTAEAEGEPEAGETHGEIGGDDTPASGSPSSS
jgi:hypothetical protein